MKETFIETANYIKLSESFARLMNLPTTAPKIGLGYGNFGLGKTFALERITAKYNAILLRATQTWTKKSMLEYMCLELGADVSGGSSRMYARVIEELRSVKRPIIIDELDTLLRSQKIEVAELLRDIHDETGVILYLIGMEEAKAKIKRLRHYYSRIVEFVEFKKIDVEDIEKFCELSDKVKIEKELVEYFATSYPNLRQIRVLLINLENIATRQGIKSCDLKTFKTLRVEKVGQGE